MEKHIVFDARVCDGRVHGISRVTEQVLKHLIVLDDTNRYTILCSNDYLPSQLEQKGNVAFKEITAPLYSIREQVDVLRTASALKPDLFHSPTFTAPYFASFPITVHIHDLIPMVYPDFFSLKYKFYYNFFVRKAAQKACRVITSSKCSRTDIARFFAIDPQKVSVVYNSGYVPDDTDEPLSMGDLKKGYILFVGNEMPHKNFIRAAKAFGKLQLKLPEEKLQMAAVGVSAQYYKDSPVQAVPNIECIKYLDPQQLRALYKNAGVLLFPSLYEGFGIPPLEAMSYGVPVISSDCSCMPEVLEDAYCRVNPENVTEMAEALYEVKMNDKFRAALIAKGHKQVKKYSWQKSAQQLLNIYREVLS